MQHRHLNHACFPSAAIDDVIARGGRADWAALRQAILDNPLLLEKILTICRAHVVDPYAQRYHFWKHYADWHLAQPGEGRV